MSMVCMVNEKHREGVPVWRVCLLHLFDRILQIPVPVPEQNLALYYRFSKQMLKNLESLFTVFFKVFLMKETSA